MGIRLQKSAQSSDRSELLRIMYTQMLLTRLVDLYAWHAYKQGKLGFVAPCRGHEAAQIGSALCIEVGQDFTLPYYRDLGVVLTIGMTPEEVFRTYLQARQEPALPVSETDGPPRHLVQPVSYWGYHKHNLVTAPAPVATQIMHAAGIAFACKLRKSAVVTIAYCGDGATSESDFREGITFAAQHQLPALFICERAVSSTQKCALDSLPIPQGLHHERIDGADVWLIYTATQEAMQRARANLGPTLLEVNITRVEPGSATAISPQDPLMCCQQLLRTLNAWDEEWACELEQRLRSEVERTLEDVLNSSY